MANNLMIKSKSNEALVLTESFDSTPNSKKYIFSGVFTACSVPGHVVINRNNRSYPAKEMLKHLGYLREMIKTSGSILGELDHPEGRFDIQLKEASHKITDLWYDDKNYNIMGKLELLDTPNGKIAQQLIEAGYPLFVSSRAAGDVNEKTHEVEIAQIFTYDIVCTPGFAEAKLERVNESLDVKAAGYLTESVNSQLKAAEATKSKYKVITEGVSVCETEQDVVLNEKCMKIKNMPVNIKSLTKPLLEDEEEFELPSANVDPNKDDEGEKDNKETKEEEFELPSADTNPNEKTVTEEDKKKNRELILNITSEDANGVSSEEPSEDEDKSEKRDEILDIETQETTDEPVSDEEESSDEEKEETNEAEKKEDEAAIDASKAKKISADTKKDIEEYQKLIASVNKKEDIKESICRNYPFAVSLSPDNFAKFAALNPTQKKKCQKYIVEHAIFDIKTINEQWDTPLQKERRILKNWLRLADPEDVELYTKASVQEQDAIENMSRYWILETKQDVDEFWEKTGLRQREQQRIMNEEFVKNYNVKVKPKMQEVKESEHPLGYKRDYIKMLEQMY